jgi:hypothetical protein
LALVLKEAVPLLYLVSSSYPSLKPCFNWLVLVGWLLR